MPLRHKRRRKTPPLVSTFTLEEYENIPKLPKSSNFLLHIAPFATGAHRIEVQRKASSSIRIMPANHQPLFKSPTHDKRHIPYSRRDAIVLIHSNTDPTTPTPTKLEAIVILIHSLHPAKPSNNIPVQNLPPSTSQIWTFHSMEGFPVAARLAAFGPSRAKGLSLGGGWSGMQSRRTT